MTQPTAASPAAPDRRGRTTVLLVLLVAIGAVVLTLVGLVIIDSGDEASATEVLREPTSTATDPFAPPGQVGRDLTITPVQTDAPVLVEGDRVGLYGGTMSSSQCDKGQLTTFLEQNPDKAAAWAGVIGITTDEIPAYVARLTPLVLRSDTAVTNHGFVDGRATTIQSVLQAGTAVLVDEHGQPVTKCYCGNPLRPPVFTPYPPPSYPPYASTSTTYPDGSTTTLPGDETTTTRGTTPPPRGTEPPYDGDPPTYDGPEWPGWTTTSITTIEVSVTVVTVFVIVDVETGQTIERPAGTDGSADVLVDTTAPAPSPAPEPVPVPVPDEPATPTTRGASPTPAPAPRPDPSPPAPTPTTPAPTTPPTTVESTTTTTEGPTQPEPEPEPDLCYGETDEPVPCP